MHGLRIAAIRGGYETACEVAVEGGSIDLVARCPGLLIAVEFELTSARRVKRDIVKARAIGADLLLIVAANPRVKQAAERAARRLPEAPGGDQKWRVLVLSYPQAKSRLATPGGFDV